MEHKVGNIPVHFASHGEGIPILVLHGAGVDHREMVGAIEPAFRETPGYRRIYIDQPGMGRTPAPDTLKSSDDVLDVILGFADGVIGNREFLVIGHSSGGYFAAAIAARRRDQVAGVALVCPLGDNLRDVPAHQVVHASADLEDALSRPEHAGFRGYFAVHTPAMLERYERYVAPSIPLADQEALARMGERWRFSNRPEDGPPYPKPALIVTGRQDSMVGYAGQWDLLAHYPRATFAVLDRAGHALPHEQSDLLATLVAEWLRRVDEWRSA
jgi:pimeloyl-ACP methyl ester carboxylesterase